MKYVFMSDPWTAIYERPYILMSKIIIFIEYLNN